MRSTLAIGRIAWRESRTARRRLLLYMSSISLGVAALVAIDSFSENVTRSVHEQSLALTGGDIAINSRTRFTPSQIRALGRFVERGEFDVAFQTTFPSMALVPRTGGTRLAQIRAISQRYPFYGGVVTEPVAAWTTLQQGAHAIVDPALLISLDARIGDTLSLGLGSFVITGVIRTVPGDLGIAAAIGPRIYIPDRYLGETGLLVFGSRAEYDAVLRVPGSVIPRRMIARLSSALGTTRVRSAGYNEERLADAIEELRDFLAIVGLIALLLGGIGVASGVHAFVMRKIDTVAVLRCLGATSWQVLFIYVAQAAVMGLVGAVAGAAAGVGLQFLLPRVVEQFLPLDVVVQPEPVAIALGVGVGVWVALVFSLRPLVGLRRVSPLQALRRDTDEEVLRRTSRDPFSIGVSIAIVGSLVLLGISRTRTLADGLAYSGAIAGAIGVLYLAAVVLSWLARRLVRPTMPFPIRQGVAALYRPGNQTRAVVLALGFGVFLMSTLYQTQRNILASLNFTLDQAKANVVFFDVQEDQRPGVDSILEAGGFALQEATPIIRMRIASINGTPARVLTEGRRPNGERRAGWAIRREYNSTYRDSITDAEQVTAGRWFDSDTTGGAEVSIEADVAREMDLELGDRITWNVQGVEIPTRVTSFREVRWASFQPNFFVIFEPGTLDDAPKQFVMLATVSSPDAMARLQRDVVRAYPSISSIDLTLVQQTIGDVVGKVTVAIRFLALLSLALSIPVLFSAVAATRRQRLREGVLLKTLGASRAQIRRIMLSEYLLLGALGASSGILLSVGSSWALLRFVFEQPFTVAVVPLVTVAAAMMALSVTIGLLTGREVFAQTPMAALRDAA